MKNEISLDSLQNRVHDSSQGSSLGIDARGQAVVLPASQEVINEALIRDINRHES